MGDISNGQGLNRYAYCEGNPVSMVDPFGLSPQISQDQTSRFSVLHNILDLAGLAFDAADVINAAFYAAEGDWTNAALCAVAVIPIAGSAIAGAAKGTKAVVKAKKAEKILELAEESCKMTRNASDRLDVFSDVMKASSKWGNSPVKLMDGITAETGSRAIKALETGGDFGRESKRAVQELKAVAGAEGIHLKPSVSRKVDVFKDSFVKTEKAVKGGSKTNNITTKPDYIVTPEGVAMPTDKDFNLVSTTTPTDKGGEYFQIHNQHTHGNLNNPHTHKPQINIDPVTGIGSSKRLDIETSATDINYADKAMRNGSLRIRFGKKDKGGY